MPNYFQKLGAIPETILFQNYSEWTANVLQEQSDFLTG